MPQDLNDATVRQFYRSNQASKLRKKTPTQALAVFKRDATDAARFRAESEERNRTRSSMTNPVKVRKQSSGKRR
jgi:hypothetical protein